MKCQCRLRTENLALSGEAWRDIGDEVLQRGTTQADGRAFVCCKAEVHLPPRMSMPPATLSRTCCGSEKLVAEASVHWLHSLQHFYQKTLL